MPDDDKGKGLNPLAGMPPWAWVLVAMGGGSGLGIGGMKLSLEEQGENDQVECPNQEDLATAIDRAESAEASHRAMIDSLQLIAALLGECQEEYGVESQ